MSLHTLASPFENVIISEFLHRPAKTENLP